VCGADVCSSWEWLSSLAHVLSSSCNGALSFRISLEPVLFLKESSSVNDVVVVAVSLLPSFPLWFVPCLSFTSACVFRGVVHRHLALSFVLEQGAPWVSSVPSCLASGILLLAVGLPHCSLSLSVCPCLHPFVGILPRLAVGPVSALQCWPMKCVQSPWERRACFLSGRS